MQLLNSSVVFFPGEWCSPGLASAAALGLQQKALSGTTAADGSTVQMFNLTLAVEIRNSSAAAAGEQCCTWDVAVAEQPSGSGYV